MQELNMIEINAISGGAETTQTITITGKRMSWWEKLMYDLGF